MIADDRVWLFREVVGPETEVSCCCCQLHIFFHVLFKASALRQVSIDFQHESELAVLVVHQCLIAMYDDLASIATHLRQLSLPLSFPAQDFVAVYQSIENVRLQ